MNNKNDLEDDGRITFYYSREERMKKASQAVRDLNSGKGPQKKGLFRTLTSTRPLTYLFVSIITLSITILILSRYLSAEGTRVLGENTVIASVITAGNKSYITVKKAAKNGTAYTGMVNIAVSLQSEEAPVHTEQIYFTPEREEVFRFTAPFAGKKILILMEAGSGRVLFSVTPET